MKRAPVIVFERVLVPQVAHPQIVAWIKASETIRLARRQMRAAKKRAN